MVKNFTEEQIKDLREAFLLFDKDDDGTVANYCTKKLGTTMRYLGMNPTDAELQNRINEVDADKLERMNFEDFITMVTLTTRNSDFEEDIKEDFRLFDKDRNRFFSAADLRHVVEHFGVKLTDKEFNELIVEPDTDGYGQVDVEFLRIISTKINEQFVR